MSTYLAGWRLARMATTFRRSQYGCRAILVVAPRILLTGSCVEVAYYMHTVNFIYMLGFIHYCAVCIYQVLVYCAYCMYTFNSHTWSNIQTMVCIYQAPVPSSCGPHPSPTFFSLLATLNIAWPTMPLLGCSSRAVVAESSTALFCAVHATNTGDIAQVILGSTLPLVATTGTKGTLDAAATSTLG